MASNEFILNYTGEELDEAIEKFKTNYMEIPNKTLNVTQNILSPMNILEYSDLTVNVPVPDGYIEEKFGLTKAGREVFNSAEVKGPSTEDSPQGFSFSPKFIPKIIVFNLTANVPTNSSIGISSSHTSLASSFWVDNSILPMTGDNNALRKAGTFLYASNKVNVSRNNIGYEYSAKTNKIFVVLASNTRIAPVSTTNGAYEIQYWG